MRGLGTVALGVLVVLAPVASALPTPGLFGEEAETVTGRLFPEATETNDYVSYSEATEGLQILADRHPDLIEYQTVGKSLGWDNAAGGHDRFPVPVVTVTDRTSDVPMEDRVNILFQLSIHGDEKGGREGGVRVIEDFAKAYANDEELGVATDDRLAMLDYTRLIFLFHNPDGWNHEENEYRHNDAGYMSFLGIETGNFVRTNSNGTDLNRQAPVAGWNRGEGSHAALAEPSTRSVIPWMQDNFDDIDLATDIHGMSLPANAFVNSSRPIHCFPPSEAPDNPATDAVGKTCLREGNFVLTMLPAAQMEPKQMHVTTSLAEKLDERLTGNPDFAEWNTLPGAGVWGGDYHGWGTVWDSLNYVDTGFHSDFFAQEHGLDAPAIAFEYSYNNYLSDNYYPGLNQRINDYFVQTTRIIVGTFMDVADQRFDVRIDPGDVQTAWVPSDHLATSQDNGDLVRWAAENPADDRWDWQHDGYNATINDYFEDRAAVMAAETEAPLTELAPAQVPGRLDAASFDNLVIAGSAVEGILEDPDAVDAIKSFVEGGGHLLLTDDALQLLAPLGVVGEGDVDQRTAYAAYTDWVDRDHALAENVRGLARQLYEPVPLGYSTDDGGSAPIWAVDRGAFEDAGGTTVGTVAPEKTNLGEVDLGDGKVTAIGALLPDPTEEFYHPYGLASYATTYTGDQIVRNALGWQLAVDTEPRSSEDAEELDSSSTSDENDTPFPGTLGALAALGVALVLVRRRTRPER